MVVLKNKAAGLCLDSSLTKSSGWYKKIIFPCDVNNSYQQLQFDENNPTQQLQWSDTCLKISNRFDGKALEFTTTGNCDLAEWKDDYTIQLGDKDSKMCASVNNSESKVRLLKCDGGDYQKWIPLDWVDCEAHENAFNPKCTQNKRHFPNLDITRQLHCNLNTFNASSSECTEWCNANNGKCKLKDRLDKCNEYDIREKCNDEEINAIERDCINLGVIDKNTKRLTGINQCNQRSIDILKDRLNKCAIYNINSELCNDSKIMDIQSKCVSMGFINQNTKSSISTVQCNQGSIDIFLKECKEYIPKYISDESGCTSNNIINVKIRKLAEQNAENARLQDEQNARLQVEKYKENARLQAEENARLQAEKDKENARLQAEKDKENVRLQAEKDKENVRLQAEQNARLQAEKDKENAKLQAEQTQQDNTFSDSLLENDKQKTQTNSFIHDNIYIIIFIIIFMILTLLFLFNLSD